MILQFSGSRMVEVRHKPPIPSPAALGFISDVAETPQAPRKQTLDHGKKWRGARSRADLRHGYAGTIYKGQGKTLDRTYLYHTEHWRSAASYVALTRQRESAEVFVARETARDAGQLARQMARGEIRAASIAWPTRDELTQEQKREAEREDRGRKLRDALTYNTRQGGTLDQVRGLLSPAGRELVDALGAKIDREFRAPTLSAAS